ncbi:MAG: hypothetical protein WBA12_16010 [Catalinimonas sp.]
MKAKILIAVVCLFGTSACTVSTCATYAKDTKQEVKEVKMDKERV